VQKIDAGERLLGPGNDSLFPVAPCGLPLMYALHVLPIATSVEQRDQTGALDQPKHLLCPILFRRGDGCAFSR
jgi:hypothetical protein